LTKRIKKHKTGKLTVRSGFEAKIVEQLRSKKIKFEYENLKLKYTVPETVHSYKPDIQLSNGIIVECKGIWTAQDRKKMILVKQQYPELDIRMVFQRNQKLRKNAKQTYGQYCDKHSIVWAEKEIPAEWLKW
jgi:hypothetical protein